MTPHSVTFHCDCASRGFILIQPKDKNSDRCAFCGKEYHLEVKPIINGLACYVYHK